MNRLLPLLTILFLAAGCSISHPLASAPAPNNETYKVDYLFEKDGCKVYRFYDRGHFVYFTNCSGETSTRGDSSAVGSSTRVMNPAH